jgi:ASCH domain.
MKALTIHEPHASLIIMRAKRLETRGHRTNVRGKVAIHAAKKPMDDEGTELAKKYGITPQYGKVLGVVHLASCGEVLNETTGEIKWNIHTHPSYNKTKSDHEIFKDIIKGIDWEIEKEVGDISDGRFCWAMQVIEKFDTPISAKGRQGWWNFGAEYE